MDVRLHHKSGLVEVNMKHIAAFLLLTSALLADPPVAKITGPDKAHVGDIIHLRYVGEDAKHIDWDVDASAVNVPVDASLKVLMESIQVYRDAGFEVQEPDQDGPPIYFIVDQKWLQISSYDGEYRIKQAVSNDDGVDQIEKVIVVSGAVPPPVVVPPVVIPPVVVPPPIVVIPPVVVPSDFTAKLTAAVKAQPAAHAVFGRVAAVYEGVANQIKAGSVLLTTPQQVTGFTSIATAFASPEWAAIDTALVKPHLATLGLTTAAQHEGPWRSIAAAVKAGLTDIPPPVVVPPVVVPPLPVTSLHVLIIEEMDDRVAGRLPASQAGIFTSTDLVDWYEANRAQWRHWDEDAEMTQVDQKWRDAMDPTKHPRTSLPWLIVSNGTTGFEGPLPKSETELIQLLEKYK